MPKHSPSQVPRFRRSKTTGLLLLTALSHCALGLYKGAFDGGDYSLLYAAAPMMALTALAALFSAWRSRWSATGELAAVSLALFIAVLLVPIYGLGLFHLPQGLLGLVLAIRDQ